MSHAEAIAATRSHPLILGRILAAMVAMLAIIVGPAWAGEDAAGAQKAVNLAKLTVQDMRNRSFGNSTELLQRAKAIMIVPRLYKGGLVLGGEGGTGVLLAKLPSGGWSYPAFYGLGSGSLGLQIGFETAEVVFFVMSDKALRAWMENEVKLSANAGLTLIVIGSNAEAAATTNANVDVIAWAKAKGAYAGITLEGSLIQPRKAYNRAYYGKRLMPSQIVLDGAASNPGADKLRNALAAQ
jgi:SH3 domain-containing YSC84-like protein 1